MNGEIVTNDTEYSNSILENENNDNINKNSIVMTKEKKVESSLALATNNPEDRLLSYIPARSNRRIIIERLVLENFKSYSGTKIIGPFYKKFSCIVGPNGSGKSNLIDAMLFVFGRRAKKIRQNKLSDLIHNSIHCSKSPYTKVSIYFKTIEDIDGETEEGEVDEEDLERKEMLMEEVWKHVKEWNPEEDLDNFIISREATIDNQSKYRINGKVVTQKDVFDLLYKKGIDLNNNRFLILQGEVEQIAQMNPKGGKNEDGLLEYLEDIIGTNKYLDEINRQAQILEKHEEIFHEKMNRLKLVYSELKELTEPKREAHQYMNLQKYIYRLHAICNKKYQYDLRKVLKEKEEELEKFNEEKQKETKDYNDLVEEREMLNMKLISWEDEEKEVSKEHHKLDSEFQRLTTEDENLKKDLLDVVQKMQNLYVKREDMKEKKIPMYQKTYEEAEKRITEIKEVLLPKGEEHLEKCQEELRHNRMENKRELEQIGLLSVEEEKKLAPLQEQLDQIIQVISTSNNKIVNIERKQTEYSNRIETMKHNQGKILNEIKENDIKLKHMMKLDEEKRKLLKEKQDEIQTVEKMLDTLNGQYVKESVRCETIRREVTADRTKNKLQIFVNGLKKTKIKGIHGFLGDLGYIDKKYERAFLIASNNCSDYVIVEHPDDATQLFEEVRRENLGRINVLSITVLEQNLKTIMEKNQQAYKPIMPNVRRFIDLIKFKNEKYKICFYFALKETLLANTLEEAHTIGYTHKRRVVTMNGELIENDGRMCGGGIDKMMKASGSSIKTTEFDEIDLFNAERKVKEINKNTEECRSKKLKLMEEVRELEQFIDENEEKIEMIKKNMECSKMRLKDINEELEDSKSPEYTKEEQEELLELRRIVDEKMKEQMQTEILVKGQEQIVRKFHEQMEAVGGEQRQLLKSKQINAQRQLNLWNEELEQEKQKMIEAKFHKEQGKKEVDRMSKDIEEYEANEKEIENELKIVEEKGTEVYEKLEECSTRLKELRNNMETGKKRKREIDELISKKDLQNVDVCYKLKHLERDVENLQHQDEKYEKKINTYIGLTLEIERELKQHLTIDERGHRKLRRKRKNEENQRTNNHMNQRPSLTLPLRRNKSQGSKDFKKTGTILTKRESVEEEKQKEMEREQEELKRKRDSEKNDTNVDDGDDDYDEYEYDEDAEEEIGDSETSDEEEEDDIEVVVGSDKRKKEKKEIEDTKDTNVMYQIALNENGDVDESNKNANSIIALKKEEEEEEQKEERRKKKKRKLTEDDELNEIINNFIDCPDMDDVEEEYGSVYLEEESELEKVNKVEMGDKIKQLEQILHSKSPNLKVFQDFKVRIYDYIRRRKIVKKVRKEKDEIKKAYDTICSKRREEFLKAFQIISIKLKEMYQMIAIGGDAELEIIDTSEIFSEGILFSVRPPKKSWKHIQKLSGGEKTLSSLALVFALHYFKPNPIYFMDEIDAALDFKNVSIISHYIKTKTNDAQFIVISLRNQMFELCDRMIGIYKTNDITKCISINPHKFLKNEVKEEVD